MIKGMYSSAAGMIPRVKSQERIANNIANATTAGFKKDKAFVRELSRAEQRLTPSQVDWRKPVAEQTYVDYSAGIFDRTDNPLDLAIEGDGFFLLQDDQGGQYLTRAGTFSVNADGILEFPNGYSLIGDGGSIGVGSGAVTVSATGEVQSDGNLVGRITPVTVPDVQDLQKIGHSMFVLPAGSQPAPATEFSIRQGYLETSNVEIVREMVDMMVAYRTYEANAKALQTQDGSLDHLFQRVAGR